MATLRMSPKEFRKELEKSVYITFWGLAFENDCYDQTTGRLSLDEVGEFGFDESAEYPAYDAIGYTVNPNLVITEVEFDEEYERDRFLEDYADDYADPEREADEYMARVWEHVSEHKDSAQEALNRIKAEWEVR